jgi:hypothetical protein
LVPAQFRERALATLEYLAHRPDEAAPAAAPRQESAQSLLRQELQTTGTGRIAATTFASMSKSSRSTDSAFRNLAAIRGS